GKTYWAISTMETCLRSLPRRSNFTLPLLRANRVSSLPLPTLTPGWIWVPRWRTRMLPARTNWPSPRFTPRRLASESRPLRVEPTPFLWAKNCRPMFSMVFTPPNLCVNHVVRRSILLQHGQVFGILLVQAGKVNHQGGQEGLAHRLVLRAQPAGYAQMDGRVLFPDLHRGPQAQHVVDGALCQADGAGDGGADDVRARLPIAAVALDGEALNALALHLKANCGHLTQRSCRW